jgi:hypothetical protein
MFFDDVFREKSGALTVDSLMENAARPLAASRSA